MNAFFTQHMRRVRLITGWFSVMFLTLALMSLGTRGLNYGLDFTGGMMTEVEAPLHIDSETLKTGFENALGVNATVTPLGGDGRWVIRYQAPSVEMATSEVLSTMSDNISLVSNSIVGAQVGQDLMEQSGLALFATLMAILAYLSYRFEWRLASGAMIALIHDVVLVLGFFALTQMAFDLTVFAAVLAILGYSLNDSIIIADRIREYLTAKPEMAIGEVCDNAVRSTFSRTVVTSGTTLLTVAALWFMGGEPLRGFATALFIGIVCGTWSSISIGTLLPEWLKLDAKHYAPPVIDEMP
ncbi:protein translocase subunit SecF [Thaumasiovibrio subtropicus]|uniref:protein translocase subunit SecF n=1 Tax=Thaumasiovibrio subtropicus TaxID=1891207 RepID=UPI000B35389D|nr:protein translocase subunit SecF [Thaumasiovibrio subtropicus]